MNPAATAQETFIEGIKTNNETVLKLLYQSNYHKVESYILKNNGNKAFAEDIYQEAFLVVWRNVRAGKFIPQGDNALGGYLYRIARNKWTDHLRSGVYKKTVPMTDTEPLEIPDTNDFVEEKLQQAMEAFEELKKGCRQLLSKFYFDRQSFAEIAQDLGLNTASLRNKKYRCLQELRQLAKNKS